MFKIAALVWIMLGTVFAGIAVTTILSVPELAGQALRGIPVGAIGGYVVAIPIAYWVAKRIAPSAAG